jgi:hypothetical protein
MYGTDGAFGDVMMYGGSYTSDMASRLVIAAKIILENEEKTKRMNNNGAVALTIEKR